MKRRPLFKFKSDFKRVGNKYLSDQISKERYNYFGANVVRVQARCPCEGGRSGH